jgi:glycosyltransferase involved in cell wall biosynthesis
MEASALRIMQFLSMEPDMYVIAYIMSPERADIPFETKIQIKNLGEQAATLLTFAGFDSDHQMQQERQRFHALLLSNEIHASRTLHPESSHLILSFYLTDVGFTAQHVANQCGLPHIACSRGSDLGRDLFTRNGIASLSFVVERATAIVTTTATHLSYLETAFKRVAGVFVIYNSIMRESGPKWRPHGHRGRIRVLSLGGYSVKKGTMFLLKAVEKLVAEGLPVSLTIAGPTLLGDWEKVRKEFVAKNRSTFTFLDHISQEDVCDLIVESDLFCSASLSEGCSNALLSALVAEIPIVSSSTGAIVDFAHCLSHVFLCIPGDVESLANAIRGASLRLQSGTLQPDKDEIDAVLKLMSPDLERRQWTDLIRHVVESR